MLFIFSLVIYQYGKIVSYIGCKIGEITSTVSHCSCENLGSDLTNGNTVPIQKSVIKERTDDFFIGFNTIAPSTFKISSNKTVKSCLALANGCHLAIFQPPRL